MSPEVGSTSALIRSREVSVRSLDSSGSDSCSSRKISWTGSGFRRITVFALSALHYLCTLYSAFLAWGGAQQVLLVWFAATRSKVREQRGSVQQRCMQQSPYFQIIVLEYVDNVLVHLVAFPTVDERIS